MYGVERVQDRDTINHIQIQPRALQMQKRLEAEGRNHELRLLEGLGKISAVQKHNCMLG